jgi:GT2 family glycosyltransferase
MPAYNHGRFVEAAVESVLGQTLGDLELIAIDDASSDGTWDVLASIRDERLRLYRHDANQGAHATLNAALAMARGDFVAIINSDDIFHPCRLERMLAEAQTWDGAAGLAFSDVEFVGQDGGMVANHPRAIGYTALRDFCAELPPVAWFLAGNPAISTSNFFFSRVLAERTGGFAPLRYTHDWDWALRARRHGRLSWLREPLLRYRAHDANTLSEDDSWRHVHENSFVQARALLAMGRGEDGANALQHAAALVQAMLRNESLHPISLLCFLIQGLAGADDARLLAAATGGDGPWQLQTAAETAGLPPTLFHSLRHWQDRERTVIGQAALIEERWNIIQHMSGEIASRDKWISEQAASIADKDRRIAGQAALVEERWDTIQQMSGEIANRDRQVAELEAILAAQRAELKDLNGRLLVRVTRRLDRLGIPKGKMR